MGLLVLRFFFSFYLARVLVVSSGIWFSDRDWTQALCVGSAVLATGPPRKSWFWDSWEGEATALRWVSSLWAPDYWPSSPGIFIVSLLGGVATRRGRSLWLCPVIICSLSCVTQSAVVGRSYGPVVSAGGCLGSQSCGPCAQPQSPS